MERGSCGELGEWREDLGVSLADRDSREDSNRDDQWRLGHFGDSKPPRPIRLTLRLWGPRRSESR